MTTQDTPQGMELMPCFKCHGKLEIHATDILCHHCGMLIKFMITSTQGHAIRLYNEQSQPEPSDEDQDIKSARSILSKLCRGELDKLRMCVPVQKDDDDIILSRVIDRAATKPRVPEEITITLKKEANWFRINEGRWDKGYAAGIDFALSILNAHDAKGE